MPCVRTIRAFDRLTLRPDLGWSDVISRRAVWAGYIHVRPASLRH